MNKLKVLAIGLVLSLTGAVYAFSGLQSASDSCAISKDGNCCKAKASCCKGGEGFCCKFKKNAKG